MTQDTKPTVWLCSKCLLPCETTGPVVRLSLCCLAVVVERP